jgi:leucine dehydrogenase
MRQDESEAAITPSSAVSRLHVAFLLGPRTARWDEVNSVVGLLSLRAPTVGDLPPPKTQRWVARRKAAVVTAVRSGTITMRKPYVATTPPKRNSSPGSVRLKPTAFRVCAPRAFSNTVARVRRLTPDRGADIVGLSVQRRQRVPSWRATDGRHLILCLAFFAKNSSSRITCNSWRTCTLSSRLVGPAGPPEINCQSRNLSPSQKRFLKEPMMFKVQEIPAYGYERVVVFRDDHEFYCCIAVHSTKLGPALGGCRIFPYQSEHAALIDALRLSQGMTYKASLAGLNLGGGKCTVLADHPTPELMHKIGEAIEYLDGLYVSAEDVGTTVADMRIAAEKTSHIASLAASGDPSPWTALGVMSCITAALDYTGHSLSSVWIEGLGKVGWDLAHRLHAVGAELYVSDLRPELVVKAVEEFSAKRFTEDVVDNIILYAPCAMGQVVSARNVHSIRFPIICGSANNQLIQDDYAEILQQNGVLYAPDYLANSGGVINVAAEIGQTYDRQNVKTRVGLLSEKLRHVLEIAECRSSTPLAAANMLAEARLQ